MNTYPTCTNKHDNKIEHPKHIYTMKKYVDASPNILFSDTSFGEKSSTTLATRSDF